MSDDRIDRDQAETAHCAAGDALTIKLKEMFESVASEPLPANLVDLLSQLDEAEPR